MDINTPDTNSSDTDANWIRKLFQSFEWKRSLMTVVILSLVFTIGYHTRPSTSTNDYNTSKNKKSPAKEEQKQEEPTVETLPQTTDTGTPNTTDANVLGAADTKPTTENKSNGPCKIKGNISGKNKIYHIAGGAFYDRVQPEMCFVTEQEAKAAGFRKSQR